MENKDPTLTKATKNKADSFVLPLCKDVDLAKEEIKETEATLRPMVINMAMPPGQLSQATDNNQPGKASKSTQYWFASVCIVVCALVTTATLSPTLIGWRLAALSDLPLSLSTIQYIQTKSDVADYLLSIKQYGQAASIYASIIEKIKTNKMDRQLLNLTEFKLARSLIRGSKSDKREARALVDEAIQNLGPASENSTKTLAETMRFLGDDYINDNDPYSAYQVLWAASPLWKTEATTIGQDKLMWFASSFTDLGEILKEREDWRAAYKCFERSFSLTESWGDRNCNVCRLGEMALVKANLQEPQKAINLFDQSFAMDKRLHNGNLSWSARYLPTYAWSLMATGQLYDAEKFLTKHSSDIDKLDLYNSMKDLAGAYAKNNDINKAIDILDNILKDDKYSSVIDVSQIKATIVKLNTMKIKTGIRTNIQSSSKKGI